MLVANLGFWRSCSRGSGVVGRLAARWRRCGDLKSVAHRFVQPCAAKTAISGGLFLSSPLKVNVRNTLEKTRGLLLVETAPGNSASRRLDDRCENGGRESILQPGAVAKCSRQSAAAIHLCARARSFICWANIAANACATNNWSHTDLAQCTVIEQL